MTENWIPVARVEDLEPGQLRAIVVEGVELALGRQPTRWFGRGRPAWFAVQRRCPHRYGDLAAGSVSGGVIVCPDHGYRYSLATGRRERAPDECVVRYPVRITGDIVEVSLCPLLAAR